jgi:hypothetical protein
MKLIRSLLCLFLLGILVGAIPAAEAAGSTYLESSTLSATPVAITKAQTTTVASSLQIMGNGRQNFNDFIWAAAYAAGVTKYKISYTISIREDVSGWFDREVVKPATYNRTATIAPMIDMPSAFWVTIQLEDGSVVVPQSVDEAQSLMFDVSKSYSLNGTALGLGDHRLFARVGAVWSGYLFAGSDKKDQDAPRTIVRVK